MTDVEPEVDPAAEPLLFPLPRKDPLAMPPEYAGLVGGGCPVRGVMRQGGRKVWALSQHEHVQQVLADATLSSNGKHPAYPIVFPIPEEFIDIVELPLVAMDPPGHTVQRRLLIPEFTAKRIQTLRPRIQQLVDERITAMLEKGGPVDLVRELAVPLPCGLFCELLGVPGTDADFFRRFAEATTNRNATPEEAGALHLEMDAYLERVVTEKTKNPGDDLLSRVIRKNAEEPDEAKRLKHSSLVTVAKMLVYGGFDTTANMISLGTVVLLQHPEQLAEIRENPELTWNAIDELLRFLSIEDAATVRVATRDLEIGGVLIREGEGMVALNGAANWDEKVFPDPGAFDIHRETKGHLAFGYGMHQCLGANLARVELEIVFNTLLTRIPGLRLAEPVEQLPFKHDAHIYGIYELPVTW
ncbi:cytochrome P450 [Streptomyces sp. NBC_00669]|uniref:cytochrome P450 n=1 Tax=unclassified Streptomyces TaxID=2593676 RepID=UPI002E2FD6EC|nr:cytochrome P450 [Streptomyces sp. NBC_00669]